MAGRMDQDWLRGAASLGAAAGWTPEEMRLIAELGYALAEQGRDREAVTIFEGLAALAPAITYFQSALGALRLRLGEPERAISHLGRVLAADPQDLMALVNRGEAAMQTGDIASARRDLSTAILLDTPTETPAAALCLKRAHALFARLDEQEGEMLKNA